MIEVSGVTKQYGTKVGVNDLSFNVNQGEIFGLLGPNGAGKTTTLRMLTGYLTPTSGSIKIDGTDLWEHPERVRAKIGYLPDRPPVYRDMTVSSYISFAASLRGFPKARARQRVDEVMELLGLTNVRGRLIGNLSRGYQQRVGLAQAIVHEPDVLILDEPTVGLDPVQIHEIRELIRRLGAERTVVLSSHILPEVQLLCSRVLVIDKGRVVAEDAPQRLSQSLQSGTSYKVQVLGDMNQALAVAQGISGVTRVEISGETLLITAENDVDIRPDLFYGLAEAKLPLLQLTPIEMSLEEIFLQLITHEEPAKEVTADEQNVVAD